MSSVAYADKSQTGAYNASKWNAADANEIKAAINTKVDVVGGKQLSTEDYSTTEKAFLAALTPPEIAATYAVIDTSNTLPRMILVTADENNIGDSGAQTSLYMHTGTIIKFLLTVP